MRFVTAQAQAERIRWARSAVAELDGTPSLVVAPSRHAADELVRGDETLEVRLGAHRTSLWSLVHELARLPLAAAGRSPLDGLAAEALAARALEELTGELDHLGALVGLPGLARAVARTLAELRGARIRPEALDRLGTAAGADLGRILRRYEALLELEGLADGAELLEQARATAAEGRHRLVGRPLVLLDVLPADRRTEAFLAALIAAAPRAGATCSPSAPRRGALARAAGTAAEPLDEPPPYTRLERARTRVFAVDDGEQVPPDDSVRLFSAPGEGAECVEIARAVLRHAAEDTPFDRMAILLREPDRYQAMLHEALSRASIPARFTREVECPDPAGRGLLALLACAAEDLSAERFAEYLSLGEVPDPDPAGAPPDPVVPWVEARDPAQLSFATAEPSGALPPTPDLVDPEERAVVDGHLRAPFRWEKLLVDASVVGGRDRWARRLNGLAAELAAQAEALERHEPERARAKRAELAAAEDLARFALPLVDELAGLPTSAPWRVWLAALRRLAARALRTPERSLRVLAELEVMGAVGPVGLEEVRVVLAERLGRLREEALDPEPYGRIFVGPVEEAAGRSFEVVFLPGLAEGMFPRPLREDPLLLDAERARLDPDLPRRPRAAEEERARLRQALEAAERALEASYPRLDTEQGRARVPSFYALDLRRAAEGRLPPVQALEAEAAEASGGRRGWPAPRAPEAAVDGVEFDLALVAETLSTPTAAGGEGRYLVDETPPSAPLARSLRAQWRRSSGRYGPHDGFVGRTPGALAGHRLTERAYSASALERYAACPYRFFLHAVARLRPREPVERIEHLDPLTRGRLAHAALHDWVRGLIDAGRVPFGPEALSEVLDRLSDAARAAAAELEERLAPAIPAVWAREVADIERDLRLFVRREVAEGDGWRPRNAELAFGLAEQDRADPDSRPEPVVLDSGFRVRGSIDLVEQRGDRLRVTDYKTGAHPSAPASSVVAGGRRLQPLLYAEAARATLGHEVETARLAFCTSRGRFASLFFDVGPKGRDRLQAVLQTIDRQIRRGFLPAAPEKGECLRCDHRVACEAQEEARWRHKEARADLEHRARGDRGPRASELADLLDLRRQR